MDIKTDHLKALKSNDLSMLQIEALSELLERHGAIFSETQAEMGSISSEQHTITITSNVPIQRTPYRSPQTDKAEMERQVDALIA